MTAHSFAVTTFLIYMTNVVHARGSAYQQRRRGAAHGEKCPPQLCCKVLLIRFLSLNGGSPMPPSRPSPLCHPQIVTLAEYLLPMLVAPRSQAQVVAPRPTSISPSPSPPGHFVRERLLQTAAVFCRSRCLLLLPRYFSIFSAGVSETPRPSVRMVDF